MLELVLGATRAPLLPAKKFLQKPVYKKFPFLFDNIFLVLENGYFWAHFPAGNYMFKLLDTINPLELFIFTNVIRCPRLPLWVGCFIYF